MKIGEVDIILPACKDGVGKVYDDTHYLQNVDWNEQFWSVVRQVSTADDFIRKATCHQNLRATLRPPPAHLHASAPASNSQSLLTMWAIGVVKQMSVSARSFFTKAISCVNDTGMTYFCVHLLVFRDTSPVPKLISCSSSAKVTLVRAFAAFTSPRNLRLVVIKNVVHQLFTRTIIIKLNMCVHTIDQDLSEQ